MTHSALNRACTECGTEFSVRFPSVKKRFCSKACAARVMVRNRPPTSGSGNPNFRGGQASHPLYERYLDMIGRCYRPSHLRYSSYGGRGITDAGTREIQFFLPVDLSKADPAALRIGGYYQRHPHGKWVTDLSVDESAEQNHVSRLFGEFEPEPDGVDYLFPDHAARIIQRWTHDATIIGAQPHFDTHIFERLLHRAKLVPIWHHRLIDVESLTAGHHHQRIGGLAACAESLGIPFPADEQHTALGDARMCMRIWDAIITEEGA